MQRYFGIRIRSESNTKKELLLLKDLAQGKPFYIHIYTSFESGITSRLIKQINTYVRVGFLINLALRYIPPPGQNGNSAAFASWVASAVRQLPKVSIFQITNEANVGDTTDSDGYYKNASLALVYGIKAAAGVKRKNS